MKNKSSVKLLFYLFLPVIFVSCIMDWDVQKVMYSYDYYPPTKPMDIKIFSSNTLRVMSQEYIELGEVVLSYCEYGEEGYIKGVFVLKARQIAAQMGGDGFVITNWAYEEYECPQRMVGLVVKFTSAKK